MPSFFIQYIVVRFECRNLHKREFLLKKQLQQKKRDYNSKMISAGIYINNGSIQNGSRKLNRRYEAASRNNTGRNVGQFCWRQNECQRHKILNFMPFMKRKLVPEIRIKKSRKQKYKFHLNMFKKQ